MTRERERERERERGGWRRAGEEREVLPLVLLRLFDSVAVSETTPLPATVNPVSPPHLLPLFLTESSFFIFFLSLIRNKIEVCAAFPLRKSDERKFKEKEEISFPFLIAVQLRYNLCFYVLVK